MNKTPTARTRRRKTNRGFNGRQQAIYRPMVKLAWLAYCQKHGRISTDRGGADAWYRDELMECLGENTTSRCNMAEDFDIAIRHFATLAGDEYWPVRIADAPERRYRFLCNQRLQQMGALDGQSYTWRYALGILKNMFPASPFSGDLEDCPAKILRKVFIALDRQAARLRARHAHQEGVPF